MSTTWYKLVQLFKEWRSFMLFGGDSRYFGFVPSNNIVGKAERVIVSWDSEVHYTPRFKRFFHKLI